VRGRWNDPFLQELEAFPEGSHDDQVDALSGAFAALTAASAPALDPRFRQFAPRTRL
jgi:phage terminase large subunit-like protein